MGPKPCMLNIKYSSDDFEYTVAKKTDFVVSGFKDLRISMTPQPSHSQAQLLSIRIPPSHIHPFPGLQQMSFNRKVWLGSDGSTNCLT